MEILLVWLLCGAVCYLLAKNKNRNEWIAALLGVLFGVFAVIGYAVVGKAPLEEGETKTNQ